MDRQPGNRFADAAEKYDLGGGGADRAFELPHELF